MCYGLDNSEDTFEFGFTFQIVQSEIHITLSGVIDYPIWYTRKKKKQTRNEL